MKKQALIYGSVFGLIAVIFGALGAHALKELITSSQLDSFHTGVRYQMYHAILLIVLGLSNISPTKMLKSIINLIILGIIIFSFSIYLLSTSSVTGIKIGFILGPLTPIGGLLLISGWSLMIWMFIKQPLNNKG
tara:strand:+ start:10638 stop:11039 length:402 start_codon:yes stop_codon:yes gene_type:complete